MLTVSIGGSWKMGSPLPSQAQEALSAVRTGGARGMLLRCEALAAWDSSLLVFLMQLVRAAQERGMEIRRELPHGLERLVQLAFGRPRQAGRVPYGTPAGGSWPRLGVGRARPARQAGGVCRFRGGRRPGPAALPDGALPDAASGSADGHVRVRRAVPAHHFPDQPAFRFLSWLLWVRCSSPEFGAQIYVAGLVGIGMLRVMGRGHGGGWSCPAGVGASFAALIGTMQVNEEVDALSTLGISPIDFLVLPRMLALTLMVPLLTVYADLMGILGGFLVGVAMLDLSALEYLSATVRMVSFSHGIIGLDVRRGLRRHHRPFRLLSGHPLRPQRAGRGQGHHHRRGARHRRHHRGHGHHHPYCATC